VGGARDHVLLHHELERVRDGLEQPVGADAVGADARLHARGELPLEQRDVGHHADDRVEHGEPDDEVVERLGHLSGSALGALRTCPGHCHVRSARLRLRLAKQLPADDRRDSPHDPCRIRHYRSTSPNTGSTEPMIATTSATLWPGMMCGSTARLENEAPRHFMRYGLAEPSAIR